MNNDINKIVAFMELGGQILEGETFDVASNEIFHILSFVVEEVNETVDAINDQDLAETLDGFVDIAYVALTGAIALVGLDKALRAWEQVVDINLSKVDGRFGPPIIDADTGKIKKPRGWQPPNYDFLYD